jgi:signal transduction histidine kinase/DNA-binding response OmpR family regulator/ligand-binding sensor domain-containing protein
VNRQFLLLLVFAFYFIYPQNKESFFPHNTAKERLSVLNGLSNNEVTYIFRDSRGFMWFGTFDGLNRYDGYNFKYFNHIVGNSSSLSDNVVNSIFEDSKGILWIGTDNGGLNRFNRQKETFTVYKNDPGDSNSVSSDRIFEIIEDPFYPGVLWVSAVDGLNRFDTHTGKFIKFTDGTPYPGSAVLSLCISAADPEVLWLGTPGGLKSINFRTKEIRQHTNKFVWSIIEQTERPGILWVATREGIDKFDIKKGSFINFSHDPDKSNNINTDHVFKIFASKSEPGIIYLSTFAGGLEKLFIPPEINNDDLSPANVKFFKFNNEAKDKSAPGSNEVIKYIYEDPRDKNILWLASSFGVIKIYKSQKLFSEYRYEPGNTNSLTSDYVVSMYEDKSGVLWLAASEGLSSLFIDKEGKRFFKQYHHNPDNPNSLSGDELMCITGDPVKPEVLWIGTGRRGLNKMILPRNPDGEAVFVHYKPVKGDINSISHSTVQCLYQSPNHPDVLWAGTISGGLNKLIIDENKFKCYKNDPDNPKSISANQVMSIIEQSDEPDILWIGTYAGGLNKFNILTEEFKCFMNNPEKPNSLSSDEVLAIYQFPDKPDILWIGTSGGGLNKFNIRTESIDHFTVKDGMLSNDIRKIIGDKDGNLWLSTAKGLIFYNTKSNTFRNYDASDGFPADFTLSSYRTAGGELFFGTIDGLISFKPGDIKNNLLVPEIAITDFKIFNKSVPVANGIEIQEDEDSPLLQKSVSESQIIELSYLHYFFSFEFAALDFSLPSKNQYAYKMEGFDKEWIYSGNMRYAAYTNLSPGEYLFRVKGSNNDGIWNETGASVVIIIHPPWFKTWWAYLLFSVFALVVLAASVRFYLNRQRLKHELEFEIKYAEKQEEISKMKSRFFTNISHEFRTPLTLIISPADNVLSKTLEPETVKDVSLIKKNALRLLRLINQLLDISKIDDNKLKLKVSPGEIISYIKGIVMIFESLAESKDITLSVKSENPHLHGYFDKEKLEKILINIISNALKFTPAGGKVSVTVSDMNNKVIIRVKDTGIGIPENETGKLFNRFYQVDNSHTREFSGTGIGLSLAKELTELHKGKISVASKEGEWTEFTIELPTRKEDFEESQISEEEENSFEIMSPESATLKDQVKADFADKYPVSLTAHEKVNAHEKLILLLVEDNSEVRNYIKDYLSEEYLVEEASNGEEGVKKAEEIIPDLIISDIMMPVMDGYEMTKLLKNNVKTNHIPVIVLTAKSDQESKLEGLETGADDYLVKPFNIKELKVRIRNLIGLRKKLQEIYSKSASFFLSGSNPAAGEKFTELDHPISKANEKFTRQAAEVVQRHLSEEDFTIEDFSREVAMSRAQLHRKLKAITGKSASKYIRSIRLGVAKKMIEQQEGNISEIAYSVGFSSPIYFSKCFKDEFGYSPSEQKRKYE